jgi:hypothetical protein
MVLLYSLTLHLLTLPKAEILILIRKKNEVVKIRTLNHLVDEILYHVKNHAI